MSQKLESPEQPTARPLNARPPAAAPMPRPVRHRTSNADLVHEGENDSFVSRHRMTLIVTGILVVGLGVYFMPKPKGSGPARKVEKVVMVQLPPPPPKLPPPAPPKVQPPPEKMEKQAPVEEKPKEAAPKKADNPPQTLATGIKGDGPGSGLAASGTGIGGGNFIGGPKGGEGGGKWDRYAGQVQSKISDALRRNARTKSASIARLEVRIWPDGTGRVTRAQLVGSTNDTTLDTAIQEQVLTGLQLAEPPPAGMKLPIVLRLSASRPARLN